MTPTAQTSAGRADERAGDVALLGQRLGFRHPGEPEVQQARRDALAPGRTRRRASRRPIRGSESFAVRMGEEDVRRLHVAMQDPGGVRVGEPVANLRTRLDRDGVGQLTGPYRLAEGAAGNELVRDVDVPGVARERVRAQARRVTQARCGGRLALGSSGGLPFAGNDLEGDLETSPLVAGEPDRPGGSAPERPQRPIAVEDELARSRREGGTSHPTRRLAAAPDFPPFAARLDHRGQ
jgi:hypothetical protein